MNSLHSDKCFVNGEVVLFSELGYEYKEPREGRYSFTDIMKIGICPYLFANETWEDVGLSDNDLSAHGIVGHYLMSEYLRLHFSGEDYSIRLFHSEAMEIAESCLTHTSGQARAKLTTKYQLINSSKLHKLFVTRQFNIEKYLKKIDGYINNLSDILYLIGKDYVNVYTETGIYRDVDGKLVFGKADLIIEHKDGTYTIVDHKSSFNLMYFQDMQLPFYGRALGLPIRNLVIHELSSGSSYFYSDVQVKVMEAYPMVKKALSKLEGDIKATPSEHCTGCTIDCLSAQTDKDGYVTI